VPGGSSPERPPGFKGVMAFPSGGLVERTMERRLPIRRGQRVQRMMPLRGAGAFTLACVAVLVLVGGVMTLLS
jgi:hypothetical protein